MVTCFLVVLWEGTGLPTLDSDAACSHRDDGCAAVDADEEASLFQVIGGRQLKGRSGNVDEESSSSEQGETVEVAQIDDVEDSSKGDGVLEIDIEEPSSQDIGVPEIEEDEGSSSTGSRSESGIGSGTGSGSGSGSRSGAPADGSIHIEEPSMFQVIGGGKRKGNRGARSQDVDEESISIEEGETVEVAQIDDEEDEGSSSTGSTSGSGIGSGAGSGSGSGSGAPADGSMPTDAADIEEPSSQDIGVLEIEEDEDSSSTGSSSGSGTGAGMVSITSM